MKLSAQEEYGLRSLLQVARRPHGQSVTIPEIADAEGGIVDSERGQHGGYTLTREPSSIGVSEVLSALGGPLYDPSFCEHFTGAEETCQHTATDCSIRGLWMRVQDAVDDVLDRTTLQDLLEAADNMNTMHVAQPTSALLQVETT